MLKEGLQYLLTLARTPIQTVDVGGKRPLRLIDGGYDLRNCEDHLDRPLRVRQNVTLASPKAFMDYVLRFGEESAAIFHERRAFTAVLDYHGPVGVKEEAPSWCTHRATYAPQHTNSWLKWKERHDKPMNQVDFALFIESRSHDIKAPVASKILTAVLNFKETSDATLASQTNLTDGSVDYKFVKNNKTVTANFPEKLTLLMPIFEYHDPVEIEVLVRRRVNNEGVLTIWYQYVRDLEDIVNDYFKEFALIPMTDVLGSKFVIFEGKLG